ncbi:MAG: M23 family metallopeptidase [candidate division KSB1 bacterium]|nr:M23 family metallopeptidase [candidate division KSB1 bacterium]MDZ7334743.1 M23 family metallopeptidase [candidate division KSB1 bacterium]MDZ7356705.1 M23 family metallopeptidase [candidate division KSB1 bacterium]MDZ7398615.1 M23 family metallopeptidase [candidate division KSB1 bacterium]
MREKFILFLLFISWTGVSPAQQYLWPTDASHFLTSSFAEYRPGHLHAGIDIKTWGKIGYKVFAIDDGYIMRMAVSPYGYGKVLYQKLDAGDIVVYAHLDGFNPVLHQFMKQQQRSRMAYRFDIQLDNQQFRVRRGEVIGYTGATGIGSPHLHFELRDGNNNPINPFLRGYRISDNIAPTITAISFTPLDSRSRVNGDAVPWIEKPVMIDPRHYKLPSAPFVSGKIGLAVECFDQADGVDHKFAVYKLSFYLDGLLRFSASYDKFSYSVSNMIDLDRDYRLLRRGKGQFQKLYRDPHNRLPFYEPSGNEAGVLQCEPTMSLNPSDPNCLAAGLHQFTIEIADFFGNVSVLSGNFVVSVQQALAADFSWQPPDQLLVTDLKDQDGNPVQTASFYVSRDRGISWQKVNPSKVQTEPALATGQNNQYLLSSIRPEAVIKINSINSEGIESLPLYYIVRDSSQTISSATELKLEKDFYDDYIRFRLTTNGWLDSVPELIVQQVGMSGTSVPLWPVRFNEWFGVYQLLPRKDGIISVEASAMDLGQRELSYSEQIDIRTVTPERGGAIRSNDGLCRLVFGSGSVYDNLFLRIEEWRTPLDSAYEIVTPSYQLFPQDVPLQKGGIVIMKYPVDDPSPEKLGVYQIEQNKPKFRGNKLDRSQTTVSGTLSNLGNVTVIRDAVPPYVEIMQPLNQAQLRDRIPKFLARVYDTLSGIANERSIVMRLDGELVISEYDPDEHTVKYEPDEPLRFGEHTISVRAEDNSGNERLVTHRFFILK